MNRLRLCILAWIVAGAAGGCGTRSTDRTDEPSRPPDPARPAVVKAPRVVLPSDTAKPDTMADHRQRMSELSRQLLEPYAAITAGIVYRDRRLLTGIYAPLAELTLGDSTYKGISGVADGLVGMGQRSGLTDWQRQSRVLSSHADSIYVDSGYYVMRSARAGGATHEEKGTYVSTWRHLGGPTPWVLLRDEITPGPARKRKRG